MQCLLFQTDCISMYVQCSRSYILKNREIKDKRQDRVFRSSVLVNFVQMNSNDRIRSSDFYGEYHGHKVEHLEKLLPLLRSSYDCLIWTSGDSSLDNKYW